MTKIMSDADVEKLAAEFEALAGKATQGSKFIAGQQSNEPDSAYVCDQTPDGRTYVAFDIQYADAAFIAWCFNNRAAILSALRTGGFRAGVEAAAKVCAHDAAVHFAKATVHLDNRASAAANVRSSAYSTAMKLAAAIRALAPAEPAEEKVERVARAICRAGCGNDSSVDAFVDKEWPLYTEEARAALAAIGER